MSLCHVALKKTKKVLLNVFAFVISNIRTKEIISRNSNLFFFLLFSDSDCPAVEDFVPSASSVIPDRPVPNTQSQPSFHRGSSRNSQSKLASLPNGKTAQRVDLKHLIFPKNGRHAVHKLRDRH